MGHTTSDVSVIIPFFNREAYIDEAIQSALTQTLKPLELILVNDCSRESSRRYLDRYSKMCRIVDLPVNVGLAGSRNAGVREARGRFVAFLDDDDLWLPRKLEEQRNYMDEHPECAIVHCAAWFFYKDGAEEYYKRFDPGPMTLAQSLTNSYWAIIPTCMVRTEVMKAVGGFDVTYRECEDRDFIIRCCAAGYRVEGMTEPLARVRRVGQEGLTSRHWRLYRTDLRMCWKHKAHYLRAYGPRGILSFALEKIHLPSSKTRLVDGAVRRLTRLVNVRYDIRPGYRDPVLAAAAKQPAPTPQCPPDAANFAGGNCK